MSKSKSYDFGLLDTDLTNTFPTWAPTGLAGFNSNYSGLMPGGSSSYFGSGFDLNQLSNLDSGAQMLAINAYMNNPEREFGTFMRYLPELEKVFDRRAEKAQRLGMMSNAFASLLKDVPAAIKNYAYAGRQYDPTRINIAAQQILPASSIPNMTVNIPARNYFG